MMATIPDIHGEPDYKDWLVEPSQLQYIYIALIILVISIEL